MVLDGKAVCKVCARLRKTSSATTPLKDAGHAVEKEWDK
jgi:hypothetical protein